MANYFPFNTQNINLAAGSFSPSQIKSYNNRSFWFWERALFQRACSVLNFELPEDWRGSIEDFFLYCLFKFGYVAVFETDEYGIVFQPGSLSGQGFYYQPTHIQISNPTYNKRLEIGADCELIKLTPDFFGIWDIIQRYAEQLSNLDNAINMSIVNNKFAFIIGARNKTAGEALKKIMDKINRGEPAVIYDMKLLNDPQDKAEPWQFLERSNLKQSYLTSDQLMDLQTILGQFDAEIGIPTVPYQKKERMVTSEADSRIIDSTSRSTVWYKTLKSSLEKVNLHFNLNIDVSMRYALEDEIEVNEDE